MRAPALLLLGLGLIVALRRQRRRRGHENANRLLEHRDAGRRRGAQRVRPGSQLRGPRHELWSRAQESLNPDGGRETFRQANVDPVDWIKDAETGDTVEVSGTMSTKVTGELDVAAMLHDFNSLSPDSAAIPRRTLDQIDHSLDAVEFAAWIGDDDIWRRISSETSFIVPGEQRRGAGGIRGRTRLAGHDPCRAQRTSLDRGSG